MKTEIDINDFFNASEYREYLRAPMQINGFAIASNGHVCAAIPGANNYQKCPEDKLHIFEKALIKINGTHDFCPIPEGLIFPDMHDCRECNGTSFSSATPCNECDGAGIVEFDNGFNDYECDCKTCDGNGKTQTAGGDTSCKSCRHGNAYPERSYINVLGVYVRPQYLNYIINVPDIMVAAYPAQKELIFKSGDIRGMIMGIGI